MAESTVEEAHRGGAADAGQRTPEQVRRDDGVGGQEKSGPHGEQQPADLAPEGDGGVRDAAAQQAAGEVDDAEQRAEVSARRAPIRPWVPGGRGGEAEVATRLSGRPGRLREGRGPLLDQALVLLALFDAQCPARPEPQGPDLLVDLGSRSLGGGFNSGGHAVKHTAPKVKTL
ncbi:hypothetical protein GCM10010294_15720 [Streptomyces griseoloalbus]|nr:hypothetical protein GCM10010294_15720 [Streptomyces griseoloalbus]